MKLRPRVRQGLPRPAGPPPRRQALPTLPAARRVAAQQEDGQAGGLAEARTAGLGRRRSECGPDVTASEEPADSDHQTGRQGPVRRAKPRGGRADDCRSDGPTLIQRSSGPDTPLAPRRWRRSREVEAVVEVHDGQTRGGGRSAQTRDILSAVTT